MTEPFTKYGVDAPDVPAGTRCPRCNAQMKEASPPRCLTCGTEPFESPGVPNPMPAPVRGEP